jgi:hypothetical protein
VKQEKQQQLNQQISDRKAYLDTIERDIEAVTTAGNNQLFIIRGEMEELEHKKAELLQQNYRLEQRIRENHRLLESQKM